MLVWDELWAEMKVQWQGGNKWTPTTEDMWDEMLGVLPPEAYCDGGFLVGEPWNHNSQGEAIYAAFIRRQGKYYARYMTKREFLKMTSDSIEAELTPAGG